jgi:peroxiredoxin
MDAYRDQYAQIFKDGKVTLFAISTDADTALASWAKDNELSVHHAERRERRGGQEVRAFITTPRGPLDNRTLFVIGKDGKIKTVMAPFREVDATAYEELAKAIDAAIK